MLKSLILTLGMGLCLLLSGVEAGAQAVNRQHLVFFRGTPQEFDVYILKGRAAGPTAMLLGGIHGDEPGAYLSADYYVERLPRRGNLIIVPRANFQAVLHGRRGPDGDMNRKFGDVRPDDPESRVVEVLKSLMAESDLVLTLHDGSGFYRPRWENEQANPKRYGQCVIADAARYTHPQTGKRIELEKRALAALARVNATLENPLHTFHFFNMETAGSESLYQEHRDSATYFALTQLGVPAFCIETSKNLPSMDMKIRQHNEVIEAFLELYGIELEESGLNPSLPEFSHLVIRVSDDAPLAVADGHVLCVQAGETVEVLHAATRVDRGLMVTAQGQRYASLLHTPFRVERPVTIEVRKDRHLLGQVDIAPLSSTEGERPRVRPRSGGVPGDRTAFAQSGIDGSLAMLPGSRLIAGLNDKSTQATTAAPGQVSAFLVEVDGVPTTVKPNEILTIPHDARLGIIDLQTDGGSLPAGTRMNLKGFVPKGKPNTGEDRGSVVNVAKDMMRSYSAGGKGEIYAINAEHGKTVIASCAVKIVRRPAPEALRRVADTTSDATTVPIQPVPDNAVETASVSAFLVEVDGKAIQIKPGEERVVLHGSVLKLVDIQTGGGALPKGTVMNLKGFVAGSNASQNDGEDRGCVVNVAQDMMREFSQGRKGEIYALNAEHGKTILAGCSIRVLPPVLESVTVRYNGATNVLRLGSRTSIAPGTRVEVLDVKLRHGQLDKPRYTLAGHPFSSALPQTLTMRTIAINLAVFNGTELAGKVTWIPGNK